LSWLALSCCAFWVPSSCFFLLSVWIFDDEVLPSADSWTTRWKLTKPILAPCGNGAGGCGAGGGMVCAGGVTCAGLACAGGGVGGNAGAPLSRNASDAAMTRPLITMNPFVDGEAPNLIPIPPPVRVLSDPPHSN